MDAQGASGEVWRHPSHRQGETKATGSAPRGWPSHVKSGVLHIISLAHSRSLVPGVGLPRASVPASESPPRRIGCIKQSPQDATYPFSSLLQATLPAQNRRPKIAGLLQSLVLPANDDGSVATHRPSVLSGKCPPLIVRAVRYHSLWQDHISDWNSPHTIERFCVPGCEPPRPSAVWPKGLS